MKCEVLQNCVILAEKGSIVEVTEKQYERLRKKLKPVALKEKMEAKDVEVKEVETATLPKAKKTKKEN